MASNTYFCALFLHATVVSQHVAISVKFRLWAKSPDAIPPSWPTRSASTKPVLASSQSAKVLMGIDFLRSESGFVPFLPLPSLYLSFSGFRSLSIVEALILSSFSLTSGERSISLCYSSFFTVSAMNGASLLLHIKSKTTQILLNAKNTS